MAWASGACGMASGLAGLVSAYYWRRSALVTYKPTHATGTRSKPGVVHINPGGSLGSGIYIGGEAAATTQPIVDFVKASAAANTAAAYWSAATAVLAGATSILSGFNL